MKNNTILLCLLIFFLNVLNAEERLWAGCNQYQLWFQYPSRIDMQLDWMVESDLQVLRIFLGSRGYQSWEDPPFAYSFENPIGVYNEYNLELVDYLMAECAERGIKMVIALENRSDPYLSTFGAVGMYENPSSIQAYKDRFTHFLNHYNALLDAQWKDLNDVVWAWEIQNEPGIPLININYLTPAEKHDIIRNFLTELSSHLKMEDPDTKVSLGIAGYAYYYHGGGSGDDIQTLGDIPDADIYNLHFYGGNLQSWINDNLGYCRSIGKLLYVQEFGATRGTGMGNMINVYNNVTQICRQNGVPWMFWRMGHRIDDGTWSINIDDAVWQQEVAPEAHLIVQQLTDDPWGISGTVGDVTGEGDLDILDLVTIVGYILDQYEFTPQQIASADFNLDGEVDVLDVVELVEIVLTP